MADSLNRWSRRIKTFYEKIYDEMMPGMRGIDEFLFGQVDSDVNSSNFSLDELVKNIHGVSFRHRGEQAAFRPYEAGTGQILEIPRASEKTGIDERIRDAVIVGGEDTESFSSREARVISQILRQHTVAHTKTRWKRAIDVIREGQFFAYGLQGHDIGLSINFNRDASLNLTYAFEDTGADINTALKNMYDAYRAKNGSGNNLCVILGSSWLKEFEEDSTVLEYMKANTSTVLLESNMMPPAMQNVQGLYQVARYRIPGVVHPIWICSFELDAQFAAYKGATEEAYMPADEAVMFSIGATRYKVQRGVDVLNDAGKATRAIGDIVFDTYDEKDPVQSIFRSSARYAFIPADVNHTCRSTGTFDES